MNIRIATKHDITSLVRIGEACRLESTVYYPPHDIDVVTASVERCHTLPNQFTIIVVEDTEVFGFIHGCVGPRSFSRDIYASSELFLVMPGKRSLKAARLLFGAFKDWGRANGAIKTLIGAASGRDLRLLMKRFGMKRIGEIYEG